MVRCEHSGTTTDMIVPTEVLDALAAASKDSLVSFLPAAAQNVLKIIDILRERTINNEDILDLVGRAAMGVVASYRNWKSLLASQLAIPQTMLDDARKLANLLNRMVLSFEKEVITAPSLRTSEFVDLNNEFDTLFQANVHTGTSKASFIPSRHTAKSSSPRIVARGRHSAVVLDSGNDRNTTTVMLPSGQATITTNFSPGSAQDTCESGRVLAEADEVLVSGSGNKETSTYFMTGGSTIPAIPTQRHRSQAHYDKKLETLTKILQDPDLPSCVHKRVAKKLEAVSRGQTHQPQLVLKNPSVNTNRDPTTKTK